MEQGKSSGEKSSGEKDPARFRVGEVVRNINDGLTYVVLQGGSPGQNVVAVRSITITDSRDWLVVREQDQVAFSACSRLKEVISRVLGMLIDSSALLEETLTTSEMRGDS